MWKVYSQATDTHPPYGLGFFPGDALIYFGVSEEDYVNAWWHGGSASGGYSVLIVYPEEKASVGITMNVAAEALWSKRRTW